MLTDSPCAASRVPVCPVSGVDGVRGGGWQELCERGCDNPQTNGSCVSLR